MDIMFCREEDLTSYLYMYSHRSYEAFRGILVQQSGGEFGTFLQQGDFRWATSN